MNVAATRPSPDPLAPPGVAEPPFHRRWRRLMAARVFIAVVLLALLLAVRWGLGGVVHANALLAVLAYLLTTVYAVVRVQPSPADDPAQAEPPLDLHWAVTVGMDLLVFSVLQFQRVGGLSFWPLFGLPVLTAAVLGSSTLALATAAASSLLLMADAWLVLLEPGGDAASHFVQAGLTGSAYFVVAWLAHQLAARLARLEASARRSRSEAQAQATLNALVMDTLADGVLVLDAQAQVQATNPAARAWLGHDAPPPDAVLAPLRAFAHRCIRERHEAHAELDLDGAAGPERVRVRARLVGASAEGEALRCVLFIQDLREQQARLLTERLAAMGRVSAAVAHEIRNPLAAIAQANALLAEDLASPAQRQLSELVRQNVQRLARVVEDVLDVGAAAHLSTTQAVALAAHAEAVVREWVQAQGEDGRVQWHGDAATGSVAFEAEHLRRLITNLLDNARRFASDAPGAIQVGTALADGAPLLLVWSDGTPLPPSVQRHLFEPFASSDPRSSGLGLFICRELCQRHGAVIAHRRALRDVGGAAVEGNEFRVTLQPWPASAAAPAAGPGGTLAHRPPFDTMVA